MERRTCSVRSSLVAAYIVVSCQCSGMGACSRQNGSVAVSNGDVRCECFYMCAVLCAYTELRPFRDGWVLYPRN